MKLAKNKSIQFPFGEAKNERDYSSPFESGNGEAYSFSSHWPKLRCIVSE